MKKYLILFLLLVPVFFLTGWIYSLKMQIDKGNLVSVPIMGYDPRDLLRGHYLEYQIDTTKFNRSEYPEYQGALQRRVGEHHRQL